MQQGSEYVLTLPWNVTFLHSKLLLDNSASFTSWRMTDVRQKWKVQLIFRGVWNSTVAWPDWPRPPNFLDISTPLLYPPPSQRHTTFGFYLRQEGAVFTRVSIRVCLSVNTIIQKLLIKSSRNFTDGWMTPGPSRLDFGGNPDGSGFSDPRIIWMNFTNAIGKKVPHLVLGNSPRMRRMAVQTLDWKN